MLHLFSRSKVGQRWLENIYAEELKLKKSPGMYKEGLPLYIRWPTTSNSLVFLKSCFTYLTCTTDCLDLDAQTDPLLPTVLFLFYVQVSSIRVRVPAACRSTEVSTDLSLRGKSPTCCTCLCVHREGSCSVSIK